MKKYARLAIAAAAGLVVGAAQADIVIDLFDGNQGPISQKTSTNPLLWAGQYGPDSNVAGEYRDLAVKKTSVNNEGFAGTEAFVNSGVYSWSVDAATEAMAVVRWDGSQAGSGTLDKVLAGFGSVSGHYVSSALDVNGIAPVISLGMGDSFLFDVLVSDLDFTFWFELYDTSGNFSKIKLESQAHFNTVSTPIPVAAFMNNCAMAPLDVADPGDSNNDDVLAEVCNSALFDFANIGAIQLILESVAGAGSVDLQVKALINQTPEPGSLALVGLGLLGAAGAGMRRRRV